MELKSIKCCNDVSGNKCQSYNIIDEVSITILTENYVYYVLLYFYSWNDLLDLRLLLCKILRIINILVEFDPFCHKVQRSVTALQR
jgi:hypothetical protein